eukprot:1158465-Pelagomonas_calceolata.AAC.1
MRGGAWLQETGLHVAKATARLMRNGVGILLTGRWQAMEKAQHAHTQHAHAQIKGAREVSGQGSQSLIQSQGLFLSGL